MDYTPLRYDMRQEETRREKLNNAAFVMFIGLALDNNKGTRLTAGRKKRQREKRKKCLWLENTHWRGMTRSSDKILCVNNCTRDTVSGK
jgi:hypothetical protein